jgi:hypothetical protein
LSSNLPQYLHPRKQEDILVDHAALGIRSLNGLSLVIHSPARWLLKTRYYPQQNRTAAPRRAHKHDEIAVFNIQGNTLEDFEIAVLSMRITASLFVPDTSVSLYTMPLLD